MSKRYIILAILLLGSALGLNYLPEQPNKDLLTPKKMLVKIYDQARYLTTDGVAKKLIEGDPGLFLIDVRSPEEYEEYALPGAINVPTDQLFTGENIDYLDQEGIDVVFYSNGDVFSEQVWMLAAEKGFDNLFILKGGLNEWFQTIMQPVPPPETASKVAAEQYMFRKGASIYFGGSPNLLASEIPVKKKEVVVRKKKKKEAEGGC